MALFGLLPQGIASSAMNSAGLPPGFNPEAPMPKQDAPPMQRGNQGIGIPGLLGIKGGFRDFLGGLGDALLIANDADPMYEPEKKRRQINDALTGFADNPAAAIRRVAAIDEQLAMEMATKYDEQEAAKAEARRKALEDDLDIGTKARATAASLLAGANEATYGAIRDRLSALGERTGIDFGLPEVYDENAIQTLIRQGIDPDKLMDNERADLNTQSQIERRAVQNRNDEAKTGASLDNIDSEIAARTARTSQGERRTRAYESRVASQNESGKGSKRTPAIAGTLPASRVPSNARLGTYRGRRVAQVGGKTYYVE